MEFMFDFWMPAAFCMALLCLLFSLCKSKKPLDHEAHFCVSTMAAGLLAGAARAFCSVPVQMTGIFYLVGFCLAAYLLLYSEELSISES